MGERADALRPRDEIDDLDGQTEAATATDATDETLVMRQDIEQTRAEMSETIDAIQQKLNPETLTEQAKEMAREAAVHAVEQTKEAVRDATVGKAEDVVRTVTHSAQDMMHGAGDAAGGARYTIFETIKQNPIPAALTGLGLTWLFMNRERRPGPRPTQYWQQGGYGRGQQPYSRYGSESGAATWDQGWSGYAQPGSSAQGSRFTSGQADEQGMAGQTIDRAKEAAGAAVGGAQETIGYAADRMQAAAGAAGSTAGSMGSGVLDTIRQNPLPAALAGASLAWLYFKRPSATSSGSAYRYGGYDASSMSGGRHGDGMAERAQAGAGQMVDQVQTKAGQVAGQAQETAGQMADAAGYQAMRAKSGVEQMLEDNPLVIGAAAMVLGALVGLPVPQTPQEHRLMGEARDTLMEKAQEAAHDTFDKVQHVAEGARDTAQQEARNQGLMQ